MARRGGDERKTTGLKGHRANASSEIGSPYGSRIARLDAAGWIEGPAQHQRAHWPRRRRESKPLFADIWLEARGASAHGAHVHRGTNAIERLMAALSALKKLEEMKPSPPKEVSGTIAAARPLSEPLGGEGEMQVLESITVNIGRAIGGTTANLVPERAAASLDIRIPMGVTTGEVEAKIQRLVGSMEGIQVATTRRYEPTWTSPSHPIATAAAEAAAAFLGQDVALNMRIGGSDARLWRRAGIPTVVAGLTPHNLGAPDEFLDIAELVPLAEIHALTAARFLGLLGEADAFQT